MKIVYRKLDDLPGEDIPNNDPGLMRLQMALIKLVKEEEEEKAKITAKAKSSKQSA